MCPLCERSGGKQGVCLGPEPVAETWLNEACEGGLQEKVACEEAVAEGRPAIAHSSDSIFLNVVSDGCCSSAFHFTSLS